MQKKLNFLMIAPTPFFADRGCHVRIYEEAKILLKRGHKVVICTYHNGDNVAGIPIYRIMNIPWYKKLSAGASFHKFYLDILLLCKAISLIKSFKPDIIYAHLHEGAFIGKILSKIFQIPLIFDYQGSLTGEMVDHDFIGTDSLLYKIFYNIEKKINQWADIIFTSSAANTPENFSVPLDDGVDQEMFSPIRTPKPIDLDKGKINVVYLGLLNSYQGLDLLLESIKIIVEQRRDFHFFIMGYPNVEFYQKKAENLGVNSFITFTGRIPYLEAANYLLIGDIAVSPKLSETEANGKLLNYMACGLPTVAFDSLVNRGILGEDGIYAKMGDPRSFAESILNLAENPKKRARLSYKLRQRAGERFSWSKRAEIIENWAYRLIKTVF